jgi:hypothetical protein
VLLVRILEIILIVLLLRAVIKIALAMIRARRPDRKSGAKRFDAKGHDIVDGDFKELK